MLQSLLAFYAVMAVKLVKDEITKKSKGYAFIQYTSQDDALLALESMDHKVTSIPICSGFSEHIV